MKKPKIKLNLNKETIAKLDAFQLNHVRGGAEILDENVPLMNDGVETIYDDPNGDMAFMSLWGSNCYKTDPLKHNCCKDKGETFKKDTSYHPCTKK